MAVLIDTFGSAGVDGRIKLSENHPADADAPSEDGQSFLCPIPYKLTSVKFWLRRAGSPTGIGYAALYNHSGVFGTSSHPEDVNTTLAISDGIDISTIGTDYSFVEFTFSGENQYYMKGNTYYCIAFQAPAVGDIDADNEISMGHDKTSPTHNGSRFHYKSTGYTTYSTQDAAFEVYGDSLLGIEIFTKPLSYDVELHSNKSIYGNKLYNNPFGY